MPSPGSPGFGVSFAGGGADGLKLAAEDVPDLVVLDPI